MLVLDQVVSSLERGSVGVEKGGGGEGVEVQDAAGRSDRLSNYTTQSSLPKLRKCSSQRREVV